MIIKANFLLVFVCYVYIGGIVADDTLPKAECSENTDESCGCSAASLGDADAGVVDPHRELRTGQ